MPHTAVKVNMRIDIEPVTEYRRAKVILTTVTNILDKRIGWLIAEIWPLKKFTRRRPAAVFDLVQPEVAPTPKKPILAPNMKWIGRPVAEIWPFKIFQHGPPPRDQIRNLVTWPWPRPLWGLPKKYFTWGVKGKLCSKFGEDLSKLSSQCWP